MKCKYFLILSVMISICIALCIAPANAKERQKENKIIIKLNHLPSKVKPGDKPFTFTKDLLEKLLPELKEPRLMDMIDLRKDYDENKSFLEDGYTFVLRGDFNRDSVADVAFVGKYVNKEDPDKNSFIAVVSIKHKKIIREFMSKVYRDRMAILEEPHFKPGINAISMSFNFAGDCAFLYWDGGKWQVDTCFERVERELKDVPIPGHY